LYFFQGEKGCFQLPVVETAFICLVALNGVKHATIYLVTLHR
jgi:hypothetical protein